MWSGSTACPSDVLGGSDLRFECTCARLMCLFNGMTCFCRELIVKNICRLSHEKLEEDFSSKICFLALADVMLEGDPTFNQLGSYLTKGKHQTTLQKVIF